jgi:cytochrome c556
MFAGLPKYALSIIKPLELTMQYKLSPLTLSASALVLAISALASPAHAQFAKPEDAIKYRKGALTVLGAHFSRVAAMAGGRAPYDAKAAAENAALAESIGKLPWAAFTEGSDKGETKAKSDIWTDKARFAESAEKMQLELAKLSAAARLGTLDALKPAVSSAAGACKNCHDNFKQ